MNLYHSLYDSPIGLIRIEAEDEGITAIQFVEKAEDLYSANEHSEACKKELAEYFEGKRKSFSIRLCSHGTDFQKKIWNELKNIPYGKTASYQELANKLSSPKASRAIGNANSKNALLIVLPCHRVIGGNGNMVGYAGEIWRKKWLLEHEIRFSSGTEQLKLSL